MADLNQKALYSAAKCKGRNQTDSGKAAKPTSYKKKPIPKGMILENDDEDGANSNVKRSLFGKLGDMDKGITGDEFAKYTDDQERQVEATATYKIFDGQTYFDLDTNRLMVHPDQTKSESNISCYRKLF
jgi:hypothetical protein